MRGHVSDLNFKLRKHPTWGGARNGAGRKKLRAKSNVPHRKRPKHSRSNPVHATLRAIRGLPSLRMKPAFAIIRTALKDCAEREGFRINCYSVQRDHLHLIVEADDKRTLASGLKSFEIRVAHRLNAFFHRRGAVFGDRYHAHELKNPREVRNALRYVMLNWAKHSAQRGFDPYSSALAFDGWKPPHLMRLIAPREVCVAPPTTWLLARGWKSAGLIGMDERPA